MINTLIHFLSMGGYGWYVWPAYASVFVLLTIQWVRPWRRWHQLIRKRQSRS